MGTSPDSHPSDEQLYELVQGTLPAARDHDMRQHLGACARCAALVQLAESARPTSAAIEPMPHARAQQMHAALAEEWELRRPGTRTARPARWRDRWAYSFALGTAVLVLGVVAVAGELGGDEATTFTVEATQPDSATVTSAGAAKSGAPAAAPQDSAAESQTPPVTEDGAALAEREVTATDAARAYDGPFTCTLGPAPHMAIGSDGGFSRRMPWFDDVWLTCEPDQRPAS
jgi:anti-sigma factor RsiW